MITQTIYRKINWNLSWNAYWRRVVFKKPGLKKRALFCRGHYQLHIVDRNWWLRTAQATNHYFNQCLSSFVTSSGVTQPKWVDVQSCKPCFHHFVYNVWNILYALRGPVVAVDTLRWKLMCVLGGKAKSPSASAHRIAFTTFHILVSRPTVLSLAWKSLYLKRLPLYWNGDLVATERVKESYWPCKQTGSTIPWGWNLITLCNINVEKL